MNSRVFYIGVAFYFGTLIYKYRDYEADTIFTSLNILLMASSASGMAAANVPSFQKALNAAQKVFNVIDEPSTLDVREGHKAKIQSVERGEIHF